MQRNLINNDKLPENLQKYFGDNNFNNLSFDKNMRMIAERLPNYGDEHSIKWLLKAIKPETFKTIIKSSRNLNNKIIIY